MRRHGMDDPAAVIPGVCATAVLEHDHRASTPSLYTFVESESRYTAGAFVGSETLSCRKKPELYAYRTAALPG